MQAFSSYGGDDLVFGRTPKAAQKRTHHKTLARLMELHSARQRLVVLWCSTALGVRAGSPQRDNAISKLFSSR